MGTVEQRQLTVAESASSEQPRTEPRQTVRLPASPVVTWGTASGKGRGELDASTTSS